MINLDVAMNDFCNELETDDSSRSFVNKLLLKWPSFKCTESTYAQYSSMFQLIDTKLLELLGSTRRRRLTTTVSSINQLIGTFTSKSLEILEIFNLNSSTSGKVKRFKILLSKPEFFKIISDASLGFTNGEFSTVVTKSASRNSCSLSTLLLGLSEILNSKKKMVLTNESLKQIHVNVLRLYNHMVNMVSVMDNGCQFLQMHNISLLKAGIDCRILNLISKTGPTIRKINMLEEHLLGTTSLESNKYEATLLSDDGNESVKLTFFLSNDAPNSSNELKVVSIARFFLPIEFEISWKNCSSSNYENYFRSKPLLGVVAHSDSSPCRLVSDLDEQIPVSSNTNRNTGTGKKNNTSLRQFPHKIDPKIKYEQLLKATLALLPDNNNMLPKLVDSLVDMTNSMAKIGTILHKQHEVAMPLYTPEQQTMFNLQDEYGGITGHLTNQCVISIILCMLGCATATGSSGKIAKVLPARYQANINSGIADIGMGNGSVIWMLAVFGFNLVYGLEISPNLVLRAIDGANHLSKNQFIFNTRCIFLKHGDVTKMHRFPSTWTHIYSFVGCVKVLRSIIRASLNSANLKCLVLITTKTDFMCQVGMQEKIDNQSEEDSPFTIYRGGIMSSRTDSHITFVCPWNEPRRALVQARYIDHAISYKEDKLAKKYVDNIESTIAREMNDATGNLHREAVALDTKQMKQLTNFDIHYKIPRYEKSIIEPGHYNDNIKKPVIKKRVPVVSIPGTKPKPPSLVKKKKSIVKKLFTNSKTYTVKR